MNHTSQQTEFHYDFVANNPHISDLERMHDNGIRLKKQQDGIFYLAASFISHLQARHYCKEFGLAVVKFRKAPVATAGQMANSGEMG